MSNNSAVIVIPARLASVRLPRKILEPIDGKPMLVKVLEQAVSANICDCYVACCCQEVKEIVENFGGKAVVTDPKITCGTERVHAAVKSLGLKPEFVINLQGDTPVFSTSILSDILSVLESDPSIDMTAPVVKADSARNQNSVKVAFNGMENEAPGKAIYFSRSAIPHGAQEFYSHVGMYAYRLDALDRFVSCGQSYLERTEKLEQLRCIQNGMNVWAVPVNGVALSVDTAEDLNEVVEFVKLLDNA
jgi:3-deoxy-manno-octulosonate cytidylyltransferase (CMP-KDO synthetase)